MTVRPSRDARGRWAEAAAEAYLTGEGYVVLARRFWVPAGEIDLVARDGEVLTFVEVRFRSDGAVVPPLSTIGAGKRARIVRAARAYVAKLRGPWPPMRFDAVGVCFAAGNEKRAANAHVRRACEQADKLKDTQRRRSDPADVQPTNESFFDAAAQTQTLTFTLVRGAFGAATGPTAHW